MTKKHDTKPEKPERQEEKVFSRRDFVRAGALAGVSAVALSNVDQAAAQTAPGITWDYEVDVLVVGGGATGLTAAIRARDLGNDVLVVDQNFDVGGRMMHSNGWVSYGGGDAVQVRDAKGEADKEGFIKVKPLHTPEELTEDPDYLFRDITDWSIVDPGGFSSYRYNDRDLHRGWADNTKAARDFMLENRVRFTRVMGTHTTGGVSRARRAMVFLMRGEKTDIKAGTISAADAGDDTHASHFSIRPAVDFSNLVAPGAVGAGAYLARTLEFSAREKGIKFMFFRHMDELIREQPFAGKVMGVRASYTPRTNPTTNALLTSYASNGNVNETRPTITIRARKGVVIGTGGHAGNPEFRAMFYPAMREPAFPTAGRAMLGPLGADASGMIAGMKVGAALAGAHQNLHPSTFGIRTTLATRDATGPNFPGHPTFDERGSAGITLGADSFEHLIAVNQVGKRFYNDMLLVRGYNDAIWPGLGRGTPNSGIKNVQNDWRNCTPEWIKTMYNRQHGVDAALAMNEGSVAPDFYSGMMWAIFDKGALDRDGWNIKAPFTSDKNGYFFTADTIEELAKKIEKNEYQRVPLKYLADTVKKWNSYVDTGKDPEFDRHVTAPMHKIATPPFYAAAIMITWHDSYGGLRINGRAQVLDTAGKVIPHLYAGGEVSGGGNQHGLGRATVHGFIAGTNVHKETV